MIATGLQLLGMVCVVLGFVLFGWWLAGPVLAAVCGLWAGGIMAMFVGIALENDVVEGDD